MKHLLRVFVLFGFSTILLLQAAAQEQLFDLNRYRDFLKNHQNLTSEGLRQLHPAGLFQKKATGISSTPKYLDSIEIKYKLTADEKAILSKNGFVVTERTPKTNEGKLQWESFGHAFADIFHKDIPVFVSTDAILHAVHMSYDAILMDVEKTILIPKLDLLLQQLHSYVPQLITQYGTDPRMMPMLKDVDLYCTVARILLGKAIQPVFPENVSTKDELLTLINAAKAVKYPLFASKLRMIDFSQFTVRGHYTQSPELSRYFQSMIWLGRTELYLIPPKEETIDGPTKEDVQRQTIDALLISKAMTASGAMNHYQMIETFIKYFVGESDNITLENIQSLVLESGIGDPSSLLDTTVFNDFQNLIISKPFAFQRINSQILFSNPFDLEQIRPASAFLLLGQRFVIDSYVTGNVVYDKIIFDNRKILRMLPSSLDVLFSLGNNAAAQLLEPELKQYKYSSNLAALRYLVDSYEPEFWNGTMYNGWLEMIRRLNPPQNRSQLPPFMQTAAWWQEKMTTQLSSWAQLRHDNLLYAKQSYTGGVICSYPYSYVEPIPEFYDALKQFAQKAETQFDLLPFDDIYMKQAMVGYFSNMQATADTLSGIARKTLTSSQFTAEEIKFLKRMLFSTPMCGKFYDGWYISLFYRGEDWAFKKDMVVADVHTAPTDEFGNSVGWVVHAGTGPINLAVVIAQISDGSWVAFVGPVMSYYENVSLNFKRYTDEEWQEVYRVSIRPSYVNVYCTDSLGNSRDEGAMLMTGVVPDKDISIPSEIVLNQNYPNPFNSGTLITFSIPRKYSGLVAELKIFDIRGRVIAELLKRSLPTGNYTIRWDGRTNNSVSAPSGTYFYRLLVGGEQKTGRMLLVR